MPSGQSGITRVRFTSTVNKVLALRLKGLAAATGISQSRLMDEAMEDLLAKYGDDPKEFIIKQQTEAVKNAIR